MLRAGTPVLTPAPRPGAPDKCLGRDDDTQHDDHVLTDLARAAARPALFQPSDAPFWDDPHIAVGLLDAHMDDSVDAASRPGATIRATVDSWVTEGLVGPGTRVLDLGCGPGRVAELLAAAGCEVTGWDLSSRSLAQASARAAEQGMRIDYQCRDFLTLDEVAAYDLVLQSFGEVATFADDVRDRLLAAVRRALAPGGAFVFDLSTPQLRDRVRLRHDEWTVSDGGFWRPGLHLVLTRHHRYDDDVSCDHYVVVDEAGVTAYRMWFHDYTPQTITPVLARAGFDAELRDGLGSGRYDGGEWLGVVARPTGRAAPRNL